LQEKRVYELKLKNQELEKFKFVLDSKIHELTVALEPKQKEIKQMKVQITEVLDSIVLKSVEAMHLLQSWNFFSSITGP
jgi:hypothetical protein